MIEIKSNPNARRQVNISEWNADVKAFVKNPNISERIVFNDQIEQFFNKSLKENERAEAGINICIMMLEDEEGNPLLSIEQMEELKQAAFEPINRVINLLVFMDRKDETIEKETVKNE